MTYLRRDTIVSEDYQAASLKLDYAGGTPGSYPGLDQFNRVIDQVWEGYGANNSGTLDGYAYGYNPQGDVAYRQNLTAASADLDEAYTYDQQDQLTSLTRGQLNTATDQIFSNTVDFTQTWTLDGDGNWCKFNESSSDANPVTNFTQTRGSNAANEITSITEPLPQYQWATPEYDNAGNMTFTPPPVDETDGLQCTTMPGTG